ncbi:MAG: protein kinase [Dehalococcoidia bacterium]|jgi:hypothetical protein|nr:protein kinase [Dehalococcoidia bacterium]
MPSERVQRRIDRLLDQADEALEAGNWQDAKERAAVALEFDPDNADAAAFLAAADRGLGISEPHVADPAAIQSLPKREASSSLPPPPSAGEGREPALQEKGEGVPTPASFAAGRYLVSKFLGEGGKKRVFLAHDTLLDREVAFALIKTEGFDQTSKERVSREAQAMGRLGVHPNIVAVLDLGQEDDGSPYMVTELMGGGDVEALLEAADREGQAQGPALLQMVRCAMTS